MQIIRILNEEKWLDDYKFFKDFKKSTYYQTLLDTYENLNTEILFKSYVHGQGHIERVILLSLILSWKYELNYDDTNILKYAASLHDTRRINDSYDTEHGHRSAIMSIDYAIDLNDSDKEILKGVMSSHARSDKDMDLSLEEFDIKDFDRARKLTKLFKDADGLDRVRIRDLDVRFLRNDFSKELVDFSQKLFDSYR